MAASRFTDDGFRPGNDGDEPPHGHISHGSAKFLLWVGQRRDREDGFDPEITELADLYEDWRDGDEQTTLAGWDDE
jgi:hypothetical protein